MYYDKYLKYKKKYLDAKKLNSQTGGIFQNLFNKKDPIKTNETDKYEADNFNTYKYNDELKSKLLKLNTLIDTFKTKYDNWLNNKEYIENIENRFNLIFLTINAFMNYDKIPLYIDNQIIFYKYCTKIYSILDKDLLNLYKDDYEYLKKFNMINHIYYQDDNNKYNEYTKHYDNPYYIKVIPKGNLNIKTFNTSELALNSKIEQFKCKYKYISLIILIKEIDKYKNNIVELKTINEDIITHVNNIFDEINKINKIFDEINNINKIL